MTLQEDGQRGVKYDKNTIMISLSYVGEKRVGGNDFSAEWVDAAHERPHIVRYVRIMTPRLLESMAVGETRNKGAHLLIKSLVGKSRGCPGKILGLVRYTRDLRRDSSE